MMAAKISERDAVAYSVDRLADECECLLADMRDRVASDIPHVGVVANAMLRVMSAVATTHTPPEADEVLVGAFRDALAEARCVVASK
jgi:hypothetical protein